MIPAVEAITRFAADLDALIAPGERVGLAVSGGPDSLALLLLAAAARPGLISVASVDHRLRDGSGAECEAVAALCDKLGVAHQTLTIDWSTPPTRALQEQARIARYAALGQWAIATGLGVVATGHHADDQAETLVMRLMRGAGVRGLAAMRAAVLLPGSSEVTLVRPLLGWQRADLEAVVASAGIEAADDPSNHDEQHERVRVRALLANSGWLDPAALARSARHLAEADQAIDYAVAREWAAVRDDGESFRYDPRDTPPEIRRRLVARMIAALASEGDGGELRGRELDHLLAELKAGRTATLRGVLASGDEEWRFRRAPPRR
jgi:tRNA(Ile)-lysidine synthase